MSIYMNIKSILKYEESWCKRMGYRNPYIDPYTHHLTSTTVTGDHTAYRKYPENRRVYDKLWIAQSQGLNCGKLEELNTNDIRYPIFIKPRWGHLSAASKNCFKITNKPQLLKYIDYPDMMWSEFMDGREGMTDFLLLHGRIVWQITYIYSEEQNGFSDVYKYVSVQTPTPPNIEQWVRDNINGHTGFVNVQYRKNRIIEVGLRPARGGMYLIGADCPSLSYNIYNVLDKGFWDDTLNKTIQFEPYYVYKCYTRLPMLYIWPQHMLDFILPKFTGMPLYEYYFEPVNNEGVVFFQFMHTDHVKGMKLKNIIEVCCVLTQITVLIAFLLVMYSFMFKSPIKYVLFLFFFVILFTRFLNPLYVNYNCYKAYMQMFLGKNSLLSQSEFDSEKSSS